MAAMTRRIRKSDARKLRRAASLNATVTEVREALRILVDLVLDDPDIEVYDDDTGAVRRGRIRAMKLD